MTPLALIFGVPGPVAASADDPLQTQKTSPEELLNADGTLNLNDGFHGTLEVSVAQFNRRHPTGLKF